MNETKSYDISKHQVCEAYRKVKANKGSAGVDHETLAKFEVNLKDNLYKIWNRMSSGSYFPPSVKAVEIPKKNGGIRVLGVPTVADRVAQTVVKMIFEPMVEPIFHPDSYGYRQGKSALDAVAKTRERCWRYNWIVEFDIRGLFDNIPHDLLMKAVEKHTQCKWAILYINRWLTAPFQKEDGSLIERKAGTPQGGVISPVLANLFMHYMFDVWMGRKHPKNPWARYADDAVIHCKTRAEAEYLLKSLDERIKECGLELHTEKTQMVYCKEDGRQENYPITSFDFLGYAFRPRFMKSSTGHCFIGFGPAVSNKSKKVFRQKISSLKPQLMSGSNIETLAQLMNPIIRGWTNYFGKFYKTEMYAALKHVNRLLTLWACRKYKGFRRHKRKASAWLNKIAKRCPELFVHWQLGVIPAVG